MFLSIPFFWFLIAFVLSGLECEIEGPYGWASDMPTCRIENRLLLFVVRPFFAGRPVTLYHCFMFPLVLLMFHVGYAQGVTFSWENECRSLAVFFLLCPTWDFLWFVLNPDYGTENFKRDEIEWHQHRPWVFGWFPVDYAILAGFSLVFATLAVVQSHEPVIALVNTVGFAVIWAFLIFATVDLIGPSYRRWRAQKKPESDYHVPVDPPASDSADSP